MPSTPPGGDSASRTQRRRATVIPESILLLTSDPSLLLNDPSTVPSPAPVPYLPIKITVSLSSVDHVLACSEQTRITYWRKYLN